VFDTNIVVVGNVLTAPEWRRTTNTNSLVANFKVASTARRLDRDSGRWIDGNSLRVRVNCWRKLAEGIASSITVGDPVVVVGRLYTRDWTDGDGNTRTMYEMEAVAVGHDLARGRGRFYRNRPTLGTSAVDDADAESRVRGESAEYIPEGDAPARYGDGLLDDAYPMFADVPPSGPASYDPVATVRGGGFEPFTTAGGTGSAGSSSGFAPDDELSPFGDPAGRDPLGRSMFDPADAAARDSEDDSDGDSDGDSDDDGDDLDGGRDSQGGPDGPGGDPEPDPAASPGARRPRRTNRKIAVSA
jgi:single-strand DNA-binding protein